MHDLAVNCKKIMRSCARPDERYLDQRDPGMGMVGWEEPGTFWLWAWPDLLDWPTQITWLFSPPIGNYDWPGDLWGVDSFGELIIVETKGSRKPQDPFEDFLPLQDRLCSGVWKPTVDNLLNHWEPLVLGEEQFIKDFRTALYDGSGDRCKYPGIVPYSCKRLATWRWRDLYLDRIAPLVADKAYEDLAKNNLARWANRQRWCPHYVGLFTILDSKEPRLSKKGRANYNTLIEKTSPSNVHVYAIDCRLMNETQVAIECWQTDLAI